MPNPFGALILKAVAFQSDSRDPERHLQDAAVLLCCMDPYAEREQFAGSDSPRLDALRRALPDSAREWRALTAEQRVNGQAATPADELSAKP